LSRPGSGEWVARRHGNWPVADLRQSNRDVCSATSLTLEGSGANNLQDANTVHADSRSITFDKSGNLILSSDGGI
jgi:hypothetical protein